MKMHKALRAMAYVSACAGLLSMLKSPAGAWGGAVWLPKLWAASWQPWLGAIGGAAALFGIRYRDRRAVVAGFLGALSGFGYTARVIRKQDHFSPVFGAGWEDKDTSRPACETALPAVRIHPARAPSRTRAAGCGGCGASGCPTAALRYLGAALRCPAHGIGGPLFAWRIVAGAGQGFPFAASVSAACRRRACGHGSRLFALAGGRAGADA